MFIQPSYERGDGLNPGSLIRLTYDYLIVATGAVPNTFGVPGVRENAFFLKETVDARMIR